MAASTRFRRPYCVCTSWVSWWCLYNHCVRNHCVNFTVTTGLDGVAFVAWRYRWNYNSHLSQVARESLFCGTGLSDTLRPPGNEWHLSSGQLYLVNAVYYGRVMRSPKMSPFFKAYPLLVLRAFRWKSCSPAQSRSDLLELTEEVHGPGENELW